MRNWLSLWLGCGLLTLGGLAGCPINPTFDPTGHVCDVLSGCGNTSFTCSTTTMPPTCVLSSSGTTGSSSGSGTSSGSSSGDCVHFAPYGAAEALRKFALSAGCVSDTECCNQACVSDPYLTAVASDSGLSPNVCETQCTTTADCRDPNAVCRDKNDAGQGYCRINYCGATPIAGGSVNGAWGGICDAGENPGTCVDFQSPNSGPAGVCTVAGDAGAGVCTLTIYMLSSGTILCPLGEACLLPYGDAGLGTEGLCVATCDPEGDGGCGAGLNCTCATAFAGGSHGHIGYCWDGGAIRCM